uniref:Uncharacterized protein n=1 Tax=Anguilla anguilla TaxID=7936 RepID=A0A0E9UI79_ANGAN
MSLTSKVTKQHHSIKSLLFTVT